MFAPDTLAILAHVREEGVFLFVEDTGDIDVGVGEEALGLAAAVDFKKVEGESVAEVHAGANGEEARDLVIHVGVERPMGVNDMGIFFGEEFGHAFDVGFGDGSVAVDLAEENRFGADDFAGRFAFGSADFSRFVEAGVANAAFAAREVKNRHFVAGSGVQRECAGAAGFGIVGVAADADDFDFAGGC